jgi:hypothetical protein
MTSSEILKIYGCMNGLIIVGYLIFSIVKKLAVKLKYQIGFRQGIQVAQFLIAASVVAPFALHHLPKETFPQIEWSEFVSIPEEIFKSSTLQVEKVSPQETTTEVAHPPPKEGFALVLWKSKTTLLLNLLLIGRPAQSSLYSMAGKTATSYIPDLTKWDLVERRKKGNYAAFIGFAPVKDPKVEVYIGIHDPNTDGTGAHGGAHAAPVFKRIVEDVLKHLNVPADNRAP